MRRAACYSLAIILVLGVAAALASRTLATWRYSRDLQCERQASGRARAICTRIEEHLEYTCCGHAIVSPGYRATLKTVIAAWCEHGVGLDDAPALAALADARDLRLSVAAQSMFRLLTGHDRHGTPEAEVSVLHPDHPSYVLKAGCDVRN